MDKQYYAQLDETLYQETLPNGLKVTLLPKNEFHKTYGIFTTNYGSIDRTFVPLGKTEKVNVPDGIAHFLEHKMFEKEAGDVFHIFGKQGASANAFTSFTRTSYLFSSTDHVLKNVGTLLDFVQTPYFTKETVDKEKGIIAQEIKMYDDEPNWRLYFGIIGNLYPKHPIHIDIAGTVESIQDITAEWLYECYHTFYHPSNMNLFVVGKMDPEEMMAFIKADQAGKQFEPAQPIKRFFPDEKEEEITPFSQIEMPIKRSKSIVGVKGHAVELTGKEAIAYKVTMNMALSMLFGTTSKNYLRLYDESVIDDSFSYEYNLDRTFNFVDIGGDAKDPAALSDAVKEILLNVATNTDLTSENLALVKKRTIGQVLQSMNSLEYIANQYSQESFEEGNLFDLVPIIESITLEQVKQTVIDFMQENRMSVCHIVPKTEV